MFSMRRGAMGWCVALALSAWIVAGPDGRSTLPLASTALAQTTGDEDASSGIFVPAPLELRRHLSAAKRALDDGEFSEAVIQLGTLLAGGEVGEGAVAQDYFLGRVGQQGTQVSLKEEALRMIGAMPPKGRELYELQFGAEARAMLNEGIEHGDFDKLTQVARRYFHTQAGNEATYFMGRMELDMDRPLSAALCFQRLMDYSPEVKRFEPELSLLQATCWARAGMDDKAKEAIERIQGTKAPFNIAGEPQRLPDASQSPLEWLSLVTGEAATVRASSAYQWVMHRGDVSRNAQSVGGMPLLNARWRLPTSNDPNDERIIDQIAQDFTDRGTVAIPTLQPLAVNDYVLMRTPRRLIGVDFRTGKRVWEWPHSNNLSSSAVENASASSTPVRRTELSQRLWEDAPYGQLSSDGRNVFFIDNLGLAGPSSRNVRVMALGMMRANGGSASETNELVGLDLTRQGYLKWRVGGDSGLDEPATAGAFFLGAPLPLMNRVYALAEVNAEIRLIVLDAETGRMLWSQQLAYLDARTIQVDQIRRLAGASPSFADGVLICPTSAGAIVALDATTRSLRWGYSYRTAAPRVHPFGVISSQQNQSPFGDRWVDSTASISQGRVVLTPIESDELYCLDLLSGKEAWEPKKRGDWLYVACIHNGRIIMVGKHDVTAIRLSDGSAGWADVIRLPDADSPSGRGFYSDGHYFLPTSGSKLLKIELNEGRVAETISTSSSLGNLACFNGEVVSQSPSSVETFYQADMLAERVDQRLKERPDDVWALTRKGELLLQAGKQDEAVAVLFRARDADNAELGLHSDEINALIVKTTLEALRSNFAAHRADAEKIRPLIAESNRYGEYLHLTALGLKEAGQYGESFDAFLELVELDRASEPAVESAESDYERVERSVLSRRDRWIHANLAALYDAAGDDARRMMDGRLAELGRSAADAEGTAELRRFVKYFGSLPPAIEARLQLAERLINSESLLDAELLLSYVTQRGAPQQAATAAERIARMLVAAKRPSEAAEWYVRLGEQWPDAALADGRLGRDAAAAGIAAIRDAGAGVLAASEWPRGEVQVESDKSNAVQQRIVGGISYQIRMEESDAFGSSRVGASFDQQRTFVLRDSERNQNARISMSSATNRFVHGSVNYARVRGRLVIVSMGFEIAAIDVLRVPVDQNYAVLWRMDLSDPAVADNRMRQGIRFRQINNPFGMVRQVVADSQDNVVGNIGPITSAGVVVQRFREIVCVDPLTGEKLWSHGNIEPGATLLGDEQRIYVIPPKSAQALVLDAVDGRLLKRLDVDPSENVWTVHGSRMLAWRDVNGKLSVRLHDFAEERDIWTTEVAAGTKGDLVGNHSVALVEPEGRLRILSLSSDRTIVDHAIAPEPSLESVYVREFADQYIVALKRPVQFDARINVMPFASNQFDYPIINGPLFAFDRTTGRPAWAAPVQVEQFGLPVDQPVDSPLLVMVRVLMQNPQSGNRQANASIAAIDRRDGRLLLPDDQVPGQTPVLNIRVDRDTFTVNVDLSVRSYKFKFTQEPRAPAPPAEVGDLSRLLADGSPLEKLEALRDEAEAAFKRGNLILPGLPGIRIRPRIVPVPAAK